LKKILAIFAHPDDEAFGTGGCLSKYAALGHPVYLVCATRGEVGEISDPSLATPETLGQVREAELRCSAETMGAKEVIFLDYRDSGMAGTAENQDRRAFINAPPEEVVHKLVGIIRRIQPEVVLTFEPNGGYGHPDHIAIHRRTVTAFHAAADPLQYPSSGPAWQAERLFYTAIPISFFKRMKQEMTELGLDTSMFNNFDESGFGWPDDQVHVIVDVSDRVDDKWEALECHQTQFGPQNLFRQLPKEQVKDLMSQETFALAWPEPGPGLHLDSLFSELPD
jgi:LmbE family N-acetylglucosaminyl deacetylase